jgi:ferredoxin hydrogenase
MEAALRMAYQSLTGNKPPENLLHFMPVRGLDDIKEATVDIGDTHLRIAVIYGTANVERFLEEDISKYHFVEVMTCPGGCISGSGQPQRHRIPPSNSLRMSRVMSMYQEDEKMALRNSIDNPQLQTVYNEFYKKPLGELSEKLLHTEYYKR